MIPTQKNGQPTTRPTPYSNGFEDQAGGTQPSSVLGTVRKMIPFSHSPFRSGQKDGRGQQVVVTFSIANTDQSIALALGHVPEQYHVVWKSAACDVYNGTNQGADWTPTKIVLRGTVGGVTVHLWVA